MKKQKKIVLSALLSLAAAAVFFVGCGETKEPASGSAPSPASAPASTVSSSAAAPAEATAEKSLAVSVVYADETSDLFEFETDQEFLRGALEDQKLIAGEESDYGLFVKTVNGVTADESKEEWWCFTKGGELLQTGVDSTPIADGDTFEITLTVGY